MRVAEEHQRELLRRKKQLPLTARIKPLMFHDAIGASMMIHGELIFSSLYGI